MSLDRAAELIAALEQTTAEISHLLESVVDDLADSRDMPDGTVRWS